MITKITDDIWKIYDEDPNAFIVIPINLSINNNENIMGAGLALDAKKRFPQLPKLVAERITQNIIKTEISLYEYLFLFSNLRLICLPTKEEVYRNSNLTLIKTGCKALVELDAKFREKELIEYKNSTQVSKFPSKIKYIIYIPLLGCGKGNLKEKQVLPILDQYLSCPRFVLVKHAELKKYFDKTTGTTVEDIEKQKER